MNKISILALVSLLIAGCGGGGSDGDGNKGGPGGSSSLTINSAPTAVFSGSQANAAALAKEIQDDVPELVGLTSTKNLPSAINTLPGGVVTTLECSSFSENGNGSGTYTVDNNIGNGGITTGSKIAISYNDCTFVAAGYTYTVKGSMTITYTRYTSETDFAMSMTYSNLTTTLTSGSDSYSYGPISGTYNIDYANGTYSFSYTLSNGGASNISSSNIITSGNNITITSATYVYNSESSGGIVKVVFDNWSYNTTTGHPVSGSITVTGANGNTVKIDATATTYTVTYTVNGVVTAYTVNH